MGKCKKRTLNSKQISQTDIYCSTRQKAVNDIMYLLYGDTVQNGKKARNKQNYKEASSIASLFGITAEELSEAGASYEDLVGFGNLILN